MTLYLESILFARETGEFARMYLVDYYQGHPVYMDDEGKRYCPIKNGWVVAPPLHGTPEFSLWQRIDRYIQVVLGAVKGTFEEQPLFEEA